MTNFQFIPVTPHPLLRPFIAKMWVFESDGRLPELEKKLIVPNANFKFAFGYRNGVVSSIGGKAFILGENELKLSGLIDTPVMLDSQEDAPTGTIGIEFHPLGAYRFFYLRYANLKNQIVDLGDLIGIRAMALRRQLSSAGTVALKLQLLQDFLIKQLERTSADPVYDYCVKRIADSGGLVTVGQLEKETGYRPIGCRFRFVQYFAFESPHLCENMSYEDTTGSKL
jgi:Domain of unknown function (DUF6597)